MNAVDELLTELAYLGVRLSVIEGRLAYDAPVGALTDDRRSRLRLFKGEVIARLSATSARHGCSHYAPVPGGDRCRSLYPNGACSRPDELMCVVWLRTNGHV
jgi:hypothetical protein